MTYAKAIVISACAFFALAVAANLAVQRETPPVEAKAQIGGPFMLTTAGGRRVSDLDFRGKLMLVFFGYTNCPDVCPTELQAMSQALDKLGPGAKDVAVIFISVDPKRDTPDAVSDYVKNFGDQFIGLSGTESEVASAAKAYRVYYRKAEAGSGPGSYGVDHSSFIYLMDRQGEYLTHFNFGATPGEMAEVLKKYLAHDKSA